MGLNELLVLHKESFRLMIAIPVPLVNHVMSQPSGCTYIVLVSNLYPIPFAYILDDGFSYSHAFPFSSIEKDFEIIGEL